MDEVTFKRTTDVQQLIDCELAFVRLVDGSFQRCGINKEMLTGEGMMQDKYKKQMASKIANGDMWHLEAKEEKPEPQLFKRRKNRD